MVSYYMSLTYIVYTMVSLVRVFSKLTLNCFIQYCVDVYQICQILTAVYLREYYRQYVCLPVTNVFVIVIAVLVMCCF